MICICDLLKYYFLFCPQQEARAKETIQQLKLEIANLTRLVEQGAGLSLGEENTVNEILKQKDELMKERDMQVDQIVSLRNQVRIFT